MSNRICSLRPWLDDERTLLAYLVRRHGAHPYPEDVIDAIALLTSWLMVAVSFLAIIGVVLESFL